MGYTLLFLGVFLNLTLFLPGFVYTQDGDNRFEFLALCQIVKIAKYFEAENSAFKDPVPTKQINDIIGNVTLVQQLVEGSLGQNQTYFLSDGHEYGTVVPNGPLALAQKSAALRKIQKILIALKGGQSGTASSIKGEIEAAEGRVSVALGQISEAAKTALYGSPKKLDTGSGTTFASSLAAAAATSAGLSLANDIAALCKTGGDGANECVPGTAANSIHAAAFSDNTNGGDLFNELIDEQCKQDLAQAPTADAVDQALGHFRMLLGRNPGLTAAGGYTKPVGSILGKRHSSSTECGNGANVCVNYQTVLASKDGIKWLKEMLKIKNKLAQIAECRTTIKFNLQRARDIEQRALHELFILDAFSKSDLSHVETATAPKRSVNPNSSLSSTHAVSETSLSSQSTVLQPSPLWRLGFSTGFILF